MKDKNLKNNDFLVSLNIDHATDEEKIALLNRIIDNELEKPENEVDMALVDECMAFIADLDGDKFKKRDDELDEGLKKITSHKEDKKPTVFGKFFSDRKRLIKTITGIAAALVLIFTSIIIITRYGELSDLISTNTAGTVDQGENNPPQPTADYITFVKEDQASTYASIEELLQTEQLDIMYPAALPPNVKIDKVVQTSYDDTQFELSFVFSSVSIEFTVTNCNLSDYEVTDQHAVFTVNGHQFSYFVNAEGTFQVNCITDKYAYRLICSNYDDLIDIICNLKELP